MRARRGDDGADANVLTVRRRPAGDFSTYTLRLVQSAPDDPAPPAGFDPRSPRSSFLSRSNARATSIAQPDDDCPPAAAPEPEIDYLAKDYASFRQLMLDRMAVLMPQWRERNPADLGVALVEAARLRRRSSELPAGRRRHRSLSRHGAAARLGAAPRAPGRLFDARRLQRARLGASAGEQPMFFLMPRERSCSRAFPGSRRRCPDDPQARARARRNFRNHGRGQLVRGAQRDRILHLERPALLSAEGSDPSDPRRFARQSQGGDDADLRRGARPRQRTARRCRSGAPPRGAIDPRGNQRCRPAKRSPTR